MKICVVGAAACGLGLAAMAFGQVVTVVDTPNAVASGSGLGSYTYDPVSDRMWIAGFTSTQELRRIDNVGGVQSVTMMVSPAQWRLYLSDGNPDYTGSAGSTATPLTANAMMLLNPYPVGSTPAFGKAWVLDATAVPRATPGGTQLTEIGKRIYTYDLQAVAPNPNPGTIPIAPPYYDGRDVFTTLATKADRLEEAGLPRSDTTNDGIQRQFAWSPNGHGIYFADQQSNSFGGIWRMDPVTGASARILAGGINTEPGVVSVGGADKIHFRGGTNSFNPGTGTTVDNTGGIDFITHDGTTTSARTVAVTKAQLNDFLDLPTTGAGVTSFSMSADADGNVYFNDTTSGNGVRRGIYKLDPQGRMVKVMNFTEWLAYRSIEGSTSTNSQALRQQVRETTYMGSGGPFTVKQLMFADSALDTVTGVYLFTPGDFDRDNAVDAADLALFRTNLNLRGTTETGTAKSKFDLNGNDGVDWKDVKILQGFVGFHDGDVDMDMAVDFDDLDVMSTNYYTLFQSASCRDQVVDFHADERRRGL